MCEAGGYKTACPYSAGAPRMKGSFTDVENSWPQPSHDQKWRTWALLTNSDAAGAS